jgi:hypothetical protein
MAIQGTIYIAPGTNSCRVYAIPYRMKPGQSPADILYQRQSSWGLADITGGHFSWEPDEAVEFSEGDGNFVAHLFIPFEYAEVHANGFELWKQHLTDIGDQAVVA